MRPARPTRRTRGSSRLSTTIERHDLALLLTRCADGDRRAFELLYGQQSSRLYGLALRITRQSSSAADAVQEALLQVWRNAARYDASRGTPESWLASLVRYRALDIARRQVRESPTDSLPDRADDSPDALTRLMTTDEGAALARCLEQLPPDRQHLIRLAFTDGLSHSELSQSLGEPLGTVKSWIRRALTSLRGCLGA